MGDQKTPVYKTQWELADAHVNQLLPVLRVIGDRGIRLDKEKLAAFNTRLDEEMAALQASFDADPALHPFRPLHPKHKDGTFGYKKPPKDTTGMVERDFLVTLEEPVTVGEVTTNLQTVRRWCKLKPFLATSPNHVKAYITAMGHKMPTVRDEEAEDGKKDTTNAKALSLLWRLHSDGHYRDFVEMRKLRKLRGTYGEWPLTERDGEAYVTTTFTLKPDTSRLSSVNPNIQNIPKGK